MLAISTSLDAQEAKSKALRSNRAMAEGNGWLMGENSRVDSTDVSECWFFCDCAMIFFFDFSRPSRDISEMCSSSNDEF